jgi:hypothetical protein
MDNCSLNEKKKNTNKKKKGISLLSSGAESVAGATTRSRRDGEPG